MATTVKHAQGPVSVKLRAADYDDSEDWVEFVRGLEDAGAQWLCLHPRTAGQKRKGKADYSHFQMLRDVVQVPVIGNGDIQTAQDAMGLLRQKTCDMVMVGRALTARPWMLWQVGEALGWSAPEGRSGAAPRTPLEEGAEYGQSLLRLLELMETMFPERLALNKFRFHLRISHVWLPFGHNLCSRASMAHSFADMRSMLKAFFNGSVTMRQTTDLRQ